MPSGRLATALTTAALLVVLSACAVESPLVVPPELPANPTIPAPFRGAAFVMDVNTLRRTVTVAAPAASVVSRAAVAGGARIDGVSLSLLGGDAVDLVVTNYNAGVAGEVVPGKVLVTFDIMVINKLDGYQLTTPTFPTPPAGVTGVLAFPIEISVVPTPGGVTTSGNEVVVSSPRFGSVVHSTNWDGDVFNFFNDLGCTTTASDCFRYERFGSIGPLGNSAAQQVGFLIDPTVGDFRVKVILGADLVPTATPSAALVTGTVSSNIGPLGDVVINVTGGFSGTTNVAGIYSIAGVTSGANKTISIQNLPPGCTVTTPSLIVTLPAGGTFTQHFLATCGVPTAPLSGTVTSSLGGALSGVHVTVTPAGGTAPAAVATNASGTWTVSQVPYLPSNNGTIVLSNLPTGCSNANPYAYTGLSAAGLIRDIVVTCSAAPATYPFTATWGAIAAAGPTGRQITLTFAIDMGLAPGNSIINGANADDLSGISFTVAYDGTGLDWTSRSLLSPGEFDLGIVTESGQGTPGAQVSASIASSSGLTKTGVIQLVRLTYNIATGYSGTITPTVVVTQATATTSGTSITPSVIVSTTPITIP